MKLKTFTSVFTLNLLFSTTALTQPNIILILLDDARALDFSYMTNLQNQIIAKGVTIPNFYITTSMCCPSRSSILRGQYAHNTNVKSNDYPTGGWKRFSEEGHEANNIATWLSSSGYQTAIFGKYLNGYTSAPETYIPPGWNKFFVTYDGIYYNYTINNDGIISQRGNLESDYQPSVIASNAIDWIKIQAINSIPFFAYISPQAPHALDDGSPPYYLPQYETSFTSDTVPRTPSFNEPDVSDKPNFIKNKPLLTQDKIDYVDSFHRARVRSIQPIDDLISNLITVLYQTNQLNNTYIFVTSDNGFFLGEHRILPAKNLAYEEATKVSMFVRGPGITHNSVINDLISNIDFAPTFARIAKITPPYITDGRNILSLLWQSTTWPRKALLLENYRVPNNTVPLENDERLSAFVTKDYKYTEHYTGEKELYDLVSDPYETQNLSLSIDTTIYSSYLSQLETCQGVTCKNLENLPPPKF